MNKIELEQHWPTKMKLSIIICVFVIKNIETRTHNTEFCIYPIIFLKIGVL